MAGTPVIYGRINMAISFTTEQKQVIDLHGCNILVSAAAGSGKTAVLVERIIRMVCNEEKPVDIDRLLIVTFTNAAAAEMRERIAGGIAACLEENPQSEHIQRQAALLHNAQITTIDSFCLYLLRNHFNEIGLDPAFRIADEGEIRLMQQETLQELLEDSFREGGESFRFCVEYFCPGGKETRLEQHILDLSRYAASFPFPEEWLADRKEDYQAQDVESLCQSCYGRYLTAHIRKAVSGCREKLDRVRRLCQEPDGPYMYGELVEAELEQLERLEECDSLQEYEAKLPTVAFGRLSSKKDDSVSSIKRELAKRLRGQVKDSIQEMADRFFATPLTLAASQGALCREPVSTLIDLVLAFDRRMQEKKQEKKIVDFSDMEHFALKILLDKEGEGVKPSPVAREYRQHFAEVLIDEYQDSNLVQEYLLRAVSGEEDGNFNRFMVGDVKQSIYKFRLARPELFLEKYDAYETGQGNCRRIDLARNFRSRVQVVEAVNDIFSRLMSRETGGLEYDDRAALYPGAVYPENGNDKGDDGSGRGNGNVYDCGGDNDSELILADKPEGGADIKELEAGAIAKRIKELHATFMVTDRDSGTLRHAKFSDMVILLRTTSGWDEEFKRVLEKEGIPVYITSKTGYFSAVEVQELLQLLRVLDNPRQDIPLFGVLKSVFGGFSEEEAALIRSQKKEGSLYEALEAYAGAGRQEKTETCRREETEAESALRRKAAVFLERIACYRELTVYMPIRELLTRLVQDFDYMDYVTALPGGSKRRANVEMLFARASDFEKTSYFGLFHFIRYIEQLEKYDVDYGEAELLDENADVVRIMSIHKSKGLEFPIVFVSGMGKRFNMQDTNRSLIVDMDMGLGTDYADPERRLRNKTLRRNALSVKLRAESLSEELRVLYVALTRAREKLIMTGALENAEEKWEQHRESGRGRLSYLDFMEAGSYLDFLLPVLKDTCVRVSLVHQDELDAEEFREQISLGERRALLERAAGLSDKEAYEKLKRRLTSVYAHKSLAGLYTKTTVSELKIAAMADKDEAAYHTFEEKEVQPYIPLFKRGEEKVSGTLRGNAYHRVMELLDFDRIMGAGAQKERKEALHTFLMEQTEKKRLTEEYFRAVREDKILHFLESDLGARMRRAQREGRLYREQPFVLGINADRLGTGFPAEETVLIQGIIDVFFIEGTGLTLLDYKTDSVRSMQELWKRYETQLDYYQEALQKLMQMPVKERILYSFHLEAY